LFFDAYQNVVSFNKHGQLSKDIVKAHTWNLYNEVWLAKYIWYDKTFMCNGEW